MKYNATPLTEEQKTLAAKYYHLARILARKWARNKFHNVGRYDYDEYLSLAHVGLLNSVRKYDWTKGPLDDYIIRGINLTLRRIARAEKLRGYRTKPNSQSPRLCSIYHIDPGEDNNERSIAKCLYTYDDLDFGPSIQELINSLPKKWWITLTLVWVDGMSQQQSARQLNVTKQRVSRIVKEAREILADRRYNWLDG